MSKHALYEFAVYFYLHFQYNGWFSLAIIGIILNFLNPQGMNIKWVRVINLSVVLTYLLSTLGARPDYWINILGEIGGLIQIIAFVYVFLFILKNTGKLFETARFITNFLLTLSLITFMIKLFLQFFSSIPSIADWIMHSRNLIIAYLHLVLLGFVTSFLLAWWNKLSKSRDTIEFKIGTVLFLAGLAGTEITLFLYGIGIFRSFIFPYQMLLVFSIILTLSILLYIGNCYRYGKNNESKIQFQD